MDLLAITGVCRAAVLVASVVLMSGFGLGTPLTPLFVIFYDVKIAVLLVAIVHLSNNLFKLGLFFDHLDWAVLKRFGALKCRGCACRVASASMAAEPDAVVAGCVVGVGVAMTMALI
jgi:hypothetical protein